MICNIVNNKKLKKFFLKRRLRRLELSRNDEIEQFINRFPSKASKIDNIENHLSSSNFIEVKFKIKATQRLLEQFSKN